ncbi:hypothetical protein F511_25033 [Dorcoceras hygrometricum]|uniref:Triacylglycerol lipase n=1 Tax=Dorcoceras hygrometricum TaxID=472368 RepID=A0A2Z7CXB7_9LAMI|nr:hypothetical protein F511_25033 [Dorcoceras hygrometricum]
MPELNLEEKISRRNDSGDVAGRRWLPPTSRVAQISAQRRATSCAWPLATTGQHAPCPHGQPASSHATIALIVGRPPCKVAAQRRPSSAQHLGLDKASDRLPCAASAQVPRAFMRAGEGAADPSHSSDTTVGNGGGSRSRAWLQPESQGDWLFTVGGGRLRLIKSTTGSKVPSSACTRRPDEISTDGNSSKSWPQQIPARGGGGDDMRERRGGGITDSACKNHLVVVSVQYGPFNPYIAIRSTTIGKSRVVRDPIAMHTSWRSNSDIASVTRVSMTFRVVRTNQYNKDLGLFNSTDGNHLESPNEGSSIDHQVTIYLHAQNITMFPTNETWYFASQILVSSPGGLILILTAQSTRN